MPPRPAVIAAGAFSADRRGNIAVIFALAGIPLLAAAEAAVDYARAAMVRGRLAAVADAAALAATTPAMMSQPAASAKAAAAQMFAAEAAQISGLTYNAARLAVNVTDASTTNGISRTVSVSYTGSVGNAFGYFDQIANTNFTVASQANVSTAPNINFYLLLDSSSSMAIPATTSGINAMVNNTGCALACHETNYKDSEYTRQYPGWGKTDSYAYAENYGVTLRIDNVRAAAQSLVSTAQNVMTSNQANYQMAAYTFSDGVNQLSPLKPTTTANAAAMQSAFAGITPPLMSDNGSLASGASYTYPTGASSYTTVTLTANTSNDDAGTNFGNALNVLNKAMATPGAGTGAKGDSPQAVLLIVTDGVDDVSLYNSSSCNTSYYWSYSNKYGNFTRCQQPVNTALCSTIKARGVRIAVLYTTYYPVTSNSWYNSTVAPFISQVPGNLQACASSPNLFFQVSTDGDITAAMQQLFLNAVATAPHLTQ
jgi:Flp pilus assembly protein TadG